MGEENGGALHQSSNGMWRRLTLISTNTVAMEEHADEEGPKRKLLAPLAKLDPNVLQGKRLKSDTDEVCLGKIFIQKQYLGSAEVAPQPHRVQ